MKIFRKNNQTCSVVFKRLQTRCLVLVLIIFAVVGWCRIVNEQRRITDEEKVIRNYTPPEWQREDLDWVRDQNPKNKIDDLIESSSDNMFDIVVNYNRCVTEEDMQMLEDTSQTSTLPLKLEYITSVAVESVTRDDIKMIVDQEGVVFVEGQWEFRPTLNVSLPSICITPGSQNCAGNVNALGLDGTGINIVIIDSGVDNHLHQAFASTPFVAGYDATTQIFMDPNDNIGHGTHVASIALGQATANTSRGVAPGAGLIDVRIFNANGTGRWTWAVDALQRVYNNRNNWGVNVINMSFSQTNAAGQPIASNGMDSFSQLVDLASSMGIVTVVAAGNHGTNNNNPILTTPAAATRAITVAAFDDANTFSWGDDGIASFSASGPRSSDGDQDNIDELKPEVAAPGVNIMAAQFNTTNGVVSMSGTSMAAPHVAGLAALIMQLAPASVINAASVKNLIISKANLRGTQPTPPSTVWNNRLGWGYVNAFDTLNINKTTDLTFQASPGYPYYNGLAIQTTPVPLKVGKPVTVSVQILNKGPNIAVNAQIHFGIHVFSVSPTSFQDIGTKIVTLPVGTTTVSTQWIPAHAGHQCMIVEIGYGLDKDFSNNKVQRNLDVTRSPITFQVRNTLNMYPAKIWFVPTFQKPGTNWEVKINPPSVTLAADDCPVEIEVLMIPPAEASPGDWQIANIAALLEDIESEEIIELGGVSVLDIVKAPGSPEIAINRSTLNFGANNSGESTGSQRILISNSGGGTLEWSVSANVPWLSFTPTYGTNSGNINVSVNTSGLAVGSYTGIITITCPGASNSPQTVTVNLTIMSASQEQPPFGSFETPVHGSAVRSSIPVTGWVLDDVEVESVKIYNGSAYVGDAVFVEGARPDVELAYPDYPKNYRAGWGYMLLTYFLPNGGNGTYTLHAKAADSAGNQVLLGSKTITVDNANAVKPFGAIDTPTQGGTASGDNFINWGWVLTPQPNSIPGDGKTINVWVDGVNIGNPTYNNYRADIAGLFPDYANSNGAGGYFYIETTAYNDGFHTIQWTATDNAGNSDGIGSRYFNIQNSNTQETSSMTGVTNRNQSLPAIMTESLKDLPVDQSIPVSIRKGFGNNFEPQEVYADNKGLIKIEIKELERVELDFSNSTADISQISGYMVVGNQLRSLPIGSKLDSKNGKFYWQPGPGFLGEYRFLFIEKGPNMHMRRKNIVVEVAAGVE